MDDNGNCIINCNKMESLKINDKLVKLNDNEFILKQSYYTLLHKINLLIRKNNETTPIAKFFKSSIGWPSSTRMELLAVVSIVSVLNKNSSVTLYTDSANVISKFDFLKKETIFRRKRKTPNHNLWDILFLII